MNIGKATVGTKIRFTDIHPEMHPFLLINKESIFEIIEIRSNSLYQTTTNKEFLLAVDCGEHKGHAWISESRLDKFKDLIELI